MDFERMKQVKVAQAIGVSRQTVAAWTKKGMPRNKDMTYSLPDCISWLIEEAKETEENITSPEADRWLMEYRKERALKAKIERKQLEGELLSLEEVAEGWAWRVKEVTAGLTSLVERLPPLLEGRKKTEMREIIADEIWRLRDQYARSEDDN